MQPNLLRNRCFLPTKNTKYRTFYRTHFLLISLTCLSRYISLSFYRPALKETRWFFFSSWYQAGSWSRAHGWREREFIFPEREGVQGREREHFQEREEFKKGIQERIQERWRIQDGEEKCVLGIYPLLLDTPQWLSWPIRSHAGSGCRFVSSPNQ